METVRPSLQPSSRSRCTNAADQLVQAKAVAPPKKADGRQPPRLLRARRERPHDRRAAEQSDELASPHGHSLGARITPYHIVERPCCASQHFRPTDFRNGSIVCITAPQHCCPLHPS